MFCVLCTSTSPILNFQLCTCHDIRLSHHACLTVATLMFSTMLALTKMIICLDMLGIILDCFYELYEQYKHFSEHLVLPRPIRACLNLSLWLISTENDDYTSQIAAVELSCSCNIKRKEHKSYHESRSYTIHY